MASSTATRSRRLGPRVGPPRRGYGRDHEGTVDLAEALARSRPVPCEGIVDPIAPFEETPEAYRRIDADPSTGVKLGGRFGGA